jgi:hypothetical protein
MHETDTGAILVYDTTFRGGERSVINAMYEEQQLWHVYHMSSGSN